MITNRRQFLQSCAVTIGIGHFMNIKSQAQSSPASIMSKNTNPNVLVIMCDQLYSKALSCYGGPVDTPNINRIANEGVRFSQATCPTPTCSPSRATFVTGMYPHAHGVVENIHAQRQHGFTPEDTTTEKILFEDGYHTHHFGKGK